MVIIGLQETFLQMCKEQIDDLAADKIRTKTVSLNEIHETPLLPGETVLFFSDGLKLLVEKMYPDHGPYFRGKRENLIYNMGELFALKGQKNILVVNDMKNNTEEMHRDLSNLGLGHNFIPYDPNGKLPEAIDHVVISSERMLVPAELRHVSVIDLGRRIISLDTMFGLFDHFGFPFEHADLARKYMRSSMTIAEKWSILDSSTFATIRLGKKKETTAEFGFTDLVANSPAMKRFVKDAEKMAATEKPVHLYGRFGTGKKRIAQAMHNASEFSEGPFVAINCAARTPEILERELFGWEGPGVVCRSLFEEAENGTLCIEEVGKLPAILQAGLLQALSEKRIVRSGGSAYVGINTRIVTTSSRRLDRDQSGGFDGELLLLLTQYTCRIPTLNEREEDFRELVDQWLETHPGKNGLAVMEEVIDLLKAHRWEGNVQELHNVLQHMVCTSNDVLARESLPYYITQAVGTRSESGGPDAPEPSMDTSPLNGKFQAVTRTIEKYGFLSESLEILKIYAGGKQQNLSYGRATVLKVLEENGFKLSSQQLRLRLERLNDLGLLIVRPGRGGTTISEKGETYLKEIPLSNSR